MDISFASDSSLLVSVNGPVSKETSYTVLGLFSHLKSHLHSWPLNFHPAFCSILIDFDPREVDSAELKQEVEKAMGRFQSGALASNELHLIPVQYDGEDLGDVARITGLSREEVIRLHAGAEFTVAFLGFAPGFPYLIGLPEKLHCPRKKTPRVRVPRGAIAVAGANCGIYPDESPGGWQLIGRTNVQIRFQPGDRVRFTPANEMKFDKVIKSAPASSLAEFLQIASGEKMTSVQNLGRGGQTHLGISPGGAADPLALVAGNELVGNHPDTDAVEFVAQGLVEVQFLKDTWFAVTGADCAPELDQIPITMWASLPVSAGQRLKLHPAATNLRSYICVHGNSPARPPSYRKADVKVRDEYLDCQSVLRVTRGPQWDWFSREARENLFAMEFSVTDEVNRLGARLGGVNLALGYDFAGRELVSEGIANGAIQVSSGGQPMILFCEQRTTGGYPKIANVINADLFRIGQLRPGQKLRFVEISMEDSWALLT